MTTEEQDERRKAAVQAFEQREAEAARAKADRDAAQKNRAAALAQENAKWKAQTQVIRLGVMASSNGFSRQGSKFLIAPRPREGANFVRLRPMPISNARSLVRIGARIAIRRGPAAR